MTFDQVGDLQVSELAGELVFTSQQINDRQLTTADRIRSYFRQQEMAFDVSESAAPWEFLLLVQELFEQHHGPTDRLPISAIIPLFTDTLLPKRAHFAWLLWKGISSAKKNLGEDQQLIQQ